MIEAQFSLVIEPTMKEIQQAMDSQDPNEIQDMADRVNVFTRQRYALQKECICGVFAAEFKSLNWYEITPIRIAQ